MAYRIRLLQLRWQRKKSLFWQMWWRAAWPALIDLLQAGGRYTCSGAIAGPMVELDLRTLYLRDLTFTGSTVIDLDVMPRLVRYIETGVVEPLLAARFKLSDLHQAQTAFIAKKHIGNIVVVP